MILPNCIWFQYWLCLSILCFLTKKCLGRFFFLTNSMLIAFCSLLLLWCVIYSRNDSYHWLIWNWNWMSNLMVSVFVCLVYRTNNRINQNWLHRHIILNLILIWVHSVWYTTLQFFGRFCMRFRSRHILFVALLTAAVILKRFLLTM